MRRALFRRLRTIAARGFAFNKTEIVFNYKAALMIGFVTNAAADATDFANVPRRLGRIGIVAGYKIIQFKVHHLYNISRAGAHAFSAADALVNIHDNQFASSSDRLRRTRLYAVA